MSQHNSVVNFSIAASNAGAIETLQMVGREMDKVAAKQKGIAEGGKGKGKEVTDRRINKELGQDSIGDFLELMGLNEKGLAAVKTAGITIGALNATLAVTSKTLDGIASGKSAGEIWKDIATGIPILGSVATAADKAGSSIANFMYATQSTIETSKMLDASINSNRKSFEDADKAVKGYGKTLRDALNRQELANAAPEDRAAIAARQRGEGDQRSIKDSVEADVAAEKKRVEALNAELRKQRDRVIAEAAAKNDSFVRKTQRAHGIGSDAVADTGSIDAQIAANNKAAEQNERKIREAAGKAAVEVEKANALELKKIKLDEYEKGQKEQADINKKLAKETADWEAKFWEDVEKEKTKAVEDEAKRRDDINRQLMGGSAALLGDIDQLKMKMAEKQLQDQLNIGRQTRTGALAETTGFGTANQLASRERASANPMLKLMQDAEKRDERKLKALETLAAQAQAGEVSLVVFN